MIIGRADDLDPRSTGHVGPVAHELVHVRILQSGGVEDGVYVWHFSPRVLEHSTAPGKLRRFPGLCLAKLVAHRVFASRVRTAGIRSGNLARAGWPRARGVESRVCQVTRPGAPETETASAKR